MTDTDRESELLKFIVMNNPVAQSQPWTADGTRDNAILMGLANKSLVRQDGRSATGNYWAITQMGRNAIAESPTPDTSWKCFHCDETFRTREAAADHFGADESSTAACQLKASELGLLGVLRKLELELANAWKHIHAENSDIIEAYRKAVTRFSETTSQVENDAYNKGVCDTRDMLRTKARDLGVAPSLVGRMFEDESYGYDEGHPPSTEEFAQQLALELHRQDCLANATAEMTKVLIEKWMIARATGKLPQ